MMQIRPAAARGHANHGWLDSWHSFSFADYYDPEHVAFSALRVINEDFVAPQRGFGTHGHRDMEIVTYVLEGVLEHKDSMGNGSLIRPGDVQRMSAGTGVQHSEQNPSATDTVHLLQIWLHPDAVGIKPEYEQRHFDEAQKRGQLRLIVSPDGVQGSVRIHQDARIYAALLDGAESASFELAPGRRAYVHVARGSLSVAGQRLGAGDALKIDARPQIELTQGERAEVLLFDLPGTTH
ncbi:MAG TPA: pirin family protein [Steroidobacteraceae bacterium]